MTAFRGELFVEGGDFTLNAERLVVRDKVVAFSFYGVDDYGAYSIRNGLSTEWSPGNYKSDNLLIKYEQYPMSTDRAEIRFSRLEEIQQRCLVVGEWRQAGDKWAFVGLLVPFGA